MNRKKSPGYKASMSGKSFLIKWWIKTTVETVESEVEFVDSYNFLVWTSLIYYPIVFIVAWQTNKWEWKMLKIALVDMWKNHVLHFTYPL